MAKNEILGTCHICGEYGSLSLEHVPPRRAFNDRRVYVGQAANDLPFGPDEMVDRKQVQGGVKMYTLCGSCNNNTGGWYGPAFVDWCHQGMNIVEGSGGNPTLIYYYKARPLNVLKQIVTMFFSVLGPEYHKHDPDLVRFVLSREERGLPPGVQFFTYYNAGTRNDKLRYAPPIIKMDLEGINSMFSEITFPPFGYVMVMGNTEPPDRSLVNISHFAGYRYNGVREISLQLPVMATHLRMPGDYRKIA